MIVAFPLNKENAEPESACVLRAAACGFDLVSNLGAYCPKLGGYGMGGGYASTDYSSCDTDTGAHMRTFHTPMGGQKVLVVDDIMLNRVVLGKMLMRLGCEVGYAVNGDEAVQMCKKTNYHIVFMDLLMPIMDGYESTRQLRAQGCTAHISAVTAQIEDQAKQMCLEAGMDGFLMKPITMTQLVAILKSRSGQGGDAVGASMNADNHYGSGKDKGGSRGREPSSSSRSFRKNNKKFGMNGGLAVSPGLPDANSAGPLTLTLKIMIGVGEVCAFRVGGLTEMPSRKPRWEFLLGDQPTLAETPDITDGEDSGRDMPGGGRPARGRTGSMSISSDGRAVRHPIAQISHADSEAKSGDVILSPEGWALIGDQCEGERLKGGNVRLNRVTATVTATGEQLSRKEMLTTIPPHFLPKAVSILRTFVPDAICSRLRGGQEHFLSEIRRITVLFLGLPSLSRIGPDQDQLTRVQAAMLVVQQELKRYEGSLTQFRMDEKGFLMICTFGVLRNTHEDDPVRGISAATAICCRLRDAGERGAVGVTTGKLFCATVGSRRRCEFTVYGDSINLSARLMKLANEGVLTDKMTYEESKEVFHYEKLPEITVKGKSIPISVFRPVGIKVKAKFVSSPPYDDHPLYESWSRAPEQQFPIVGREAEIKSLMDNVMLMMKGGGAGGSSVVIIEGQPGMGKTKLVECLHATLLAHKVRCELVGGSMQMRPDVLATWRRLILDLLKSDMKVSARQRTERVMALLGTKLQKWAVLLNDILGLDIKEAGTGTGTPASWSGSANAFSSLNSDAFSNESHKNMRGILEGGADPSDDHHTRVTSGSSLHTSSSGIVDVSMSGVLGGSAHMSPNSRAHMARQGSLDTSWPPPVYQDTEAGNALLGEDSYGSTNGGLLHLPAKGQSYTSGAGKTGRSESPHMFPMADLLGSKSRSGSHPHPQRASISGNMHLGVRSLLTGDMPLRTRFGSGASEALLRGLQVGPSGNSMVAGHYGGLHPPGSGGSHTGGSSGVSNTSAHEGSKLPLSSEVRAEKICLLLKRLVTTLLSSPCVIIVEDAHAFDPLSWTLLRQLVSTPNYRCVIIVTSRPMEHGLPEYIAVRRMATLTTLTELSEADTHALVLQRVAGALGTAKHRVFISDATLRNIYKTTGGQPLFAEQMAVSLLSKSAVTESAEGYVINDSVTEARDNPVSQSLKALITCRIDQLPMNVVLLLKVASVIGNSFSGQLLKEVLFTVLSRGEGGGSGTGMGDIHEREKEVAEALAELEKLNLITRRREDGKGIYHFTTNTIREVIYDIMPTGQQRIIHKECALKLYHMSEGCDVPYANVAYHYTKACKDVEDVESDLVENAIYHWEKAAEDALHKYGQHSTAIKYYKEAVALGYAVVSSKTGDGENDAHLINPSRRAMWERRIAYAYISGGNLDSSIEHVKRALRALNEYIPTDKEIRERAALDLVRYGYKGHSGGAWCTSFLRSPLRHKLHNNAVHPTDKSLPGDRIIATELKLQALYDLTSIALCKNDVDLAKHACLRYLTLAEEFVDRDLEPPIEMGRAYSVASILSEDRVSAHEFQLHSYEINKLFMENTRDESIYTADILYNIAVSSVLKGQWLDAEEYVDASINIFENFQDQRQLDLCHCVTACAAYYKGDLDLCQKAGTNLFMSRLGHPDLIIWGLTLLLASQNAMKSHNHSMAALREYYTREEYIAEDKPPAPKLLQVFARAVACETKWHIGLSEAAVEEALTLSEELIAMKPYNCLYPLSLFAVLEVLVECHHLNFPRFPYQQRSRALAHTLKHLDKLTARMHFMATYQYYLKGKIFLLKQQRRRALKLFYDATVYAQNCGMTYMRRLADSLYRSCL
eukprot:jgi/Mesvir1/13481/Mv16533-RA.2